MELLLFTPSENVIVSNPENMYSRIPLLSRGTGQGMVCLLGPFNFSVRVTSDALNLQCVGENFWL